MRKTCVAFMLLLVSSWAFAQGMYWKTETEGTVAERSSENYMMPGKLKIVRSGGESEGAIVIARLDREVFWMLNPEKKTYSEMTFAEMEQMVSKTGAKMDDAMAKMKEEMKDMTPEQREMVEKMMGGKMPGGQADMAVDVQKTNQTKTIAGYSCTKYSVKEGANEVMTVWTTKGVTGFDAMAADWKKFAERMSAMNPRGGKGMADAYKSIDGFPMQTMIKMMGQTVTATVKQVERRSTPAGEFDTPAGYKKVEGEWKKHMREMDQDE
ncbi:MAG: DUF4412 domain-containing protein [Ignavibacteriae bacterium]|nr:DUF4412 domain-containing protein [Ignavibacteriota bacterium]